MSAVRSSPGAPFLCCTVRLLRGLRHWERALSSAALSDILAAQVTRAAVVAALALFVAVAVSTSVVPVAAYIAAPGPVGSALTRAKGWLARYHRPILMVAFAAIGLLYTVKGAVGLLR